MDLPFDQRSVRLQEFVEKEELPATVQVFCNNFDKETYQFVPVNQFGLQIHQLCECLETNTPYRISPEFSLGNMRAIDAIYESMRTGLAVDLPTVS